MCLNYLISLEPLFILASIASWLTFRCSLYDYLKVDDVQGLRRILIRIGRFKSLELQYTKMHIKPLKILWEDFDSRQRTSKLEMEKHGDNSTSVSFSSWLPSFYDEVLLYLEQEWKWYAGYSCFIPLLCELAIFATGIYFMSTKAIIVVC